MHCNLETCELHNNLHGKWLLALHSDGKGAGLTCISFQALNREFGNNRTKSENKRKFISISIALVEPYLVTYIRYIYMGDIFGDKESKQLTNWISLALITLVSAEWKVMRWTRRRTKGVDTWTLGHMDTWTLGHMPDICQFLFANEFFGCKILSCEKIAQINIWLAPVFV